MCKFFCEMSEVSGTTHGPRLRKWNGNAFSIRLAGLTKCRFEMGARGFGITDPADVEALLSKQFQGERNILSAMESHLTASVRFRHRPP